MSRTMDPSELNASNTLAQMANHSCGHVAPSMASAPNIDPVTGAISSMPNLSTVQEMIRILYHDQDLSRKEQASSWLGRLQSSIFAWKVADELLLAKQDIETCYFGAQTLRTKIEQAFHELPPESYVSLRDSVMNHLSSIHENAIQTQLCLAIAYLAIQTPSWTNPIEELVTRLNQASTTGFTSVENDPFKIVVELNSRWTLIEILTLMPEEVDRNSLKIGANRREEFRKYLGTLSLQVIQLLTSCLQYTRSVSEMLSSNPISQNEAFKNNTLVPIIEKIIVRIYRCLGSWLNVASKEDVQPLEPLFSAIFESLKQRDCPSSIHDAASDTVCTAALICEDNEIYPQLTQYLLSHIYSLEPNYMEAVANEDMERSINYARIFTEMAESIVDPIIMKHGDTRMVDLMLLCCGHYDYEVADITFHFWYRFGEHIFHMKRPENGQSGPFAHVINRLIVCLTRHCQLEPDLEGLLSSDSDLSEFRTRVSDLVKEIIFAVGASHYLTSNNIIQQLKVSHTMASMTWEVIEAHLFMISSIVSELISDPSVCHEIIVTILELNSQAEARQQRLHPQTLATCCLILGEMSEHIQHHPELLDQILNFLLSMIMKCGELSCISAQALQPIVATCSKQLVNNNELTQVLVQICSQLDVIKNESTANSLLHCSATMVSASLSREKDWSRQDQLILHLLNPQVERLKQIFNPACTVKPDPVMYFDRLASTFRGLRILSDSDSDKREPRAAIIVSPSDIPTLLPNTIALINDHLWPVTESILSHYAPSDTRVIERGCRCLRYMIRCLKPFWMLEKIAESIVTLYQSHPRHSSLLYLGSIIIDEFASEQQPNIVEGLVNMLHAFCTPTFALLSQQPNEVMNSLRNNPETIDDFFRLCLRFLQKLPQQFLTRSPLDSILNLTLVSLQLDHREAHSSVVKFVTELVDPKLMSQDVVSKLLHEKKFGQQLVDSIFNASLLQLPSYFLPDMADVIWLLITVDNEGFKTWLESTLQRTPRCLKPGVISATDEQIGEFHESLIKATHPKHVASALRYLYRLYR